MLLEKLNEVQSRSGPRRHPLSRGGSPLERMMMGGRSGDPFDDDFARMMMGGGPMGSMMDELFGGGMGPPGRRSPRPADLAAMMRASGSSSSPCDVIPDGKLVRVRGLTQSTEHNGKDGIVEDYNRSRDRYVVRLEDGDAVSLKREWCQQILQVQLVGLASMPELNGERATLIGFEDQGGGRFLVELSNGQKAVGAGYRPRPASSFPDTRGCCLGRASSRTTCDYPATRA